MKSQKVGPFDYLENWTPQVPQNQGLKNTPKKAKIGVNAPYVYN